MAGRGCELQAGYFTLEYRTGYGAAAGSEYAGAVAIGRRINSCRKPENFRFAMGGVDEPDDAAATCGSSKAREKER